MWSPVKGEAASLSTDNSKKRNPISLREKVSKFSWSGMRVSFVDGGEGEKNSEIEAVG